MENRKGFTLVTAQAPVNIAVIKYWGKRDENLILPINDSISVTLSMDEMCAKTTVACSPLFKDDRMWLNGIEEKLLTRTKNCLREIKQRAVKGDASFSNWPVHICSENNFPTAAGLASSAAGYACLVFAFASLFEVQDELSVIARQGSGSACRSIYGGFVQWKMGTKDDGTDSSAIQIAPMNHWPELRIIILVVNAEKKERSSTSGMKDSVKTSELIHHRASVIVPKRVEKMKSAILNRDFETFAEVTIKDSNQFHAVCLDTFPPIHYLNGTSYSIIDLVHEYNEFYGKNKVAYTFDAGPNACLFLLDQDVPEVMSLILKYFPPSGSEQEYVRGIAVVNADIPQELQKSLKMEPKPGALQFIISTKVGDGPKLMDSSEHLMNEQGVPV